MLSILFHSVFLFLSRSLAWSFSFRLQFENDLHSISLQLTGRVRTQHVYISLCELPSNITLDE